MTILKDKVNENRFVMKVKIPRTQWEIVSISVEDLRHAY